MNLNTKSSRGITLIALVVSIIVLLILAGISIMMLTGDNGILTRAGEAKVKSEETQIKEKVRLAYNSALTKDLTNGKGNLTLATFKEELIKEFGSNKINENTINTSEEGKWIVTIDEVVLEVAAIITPPIAPNTISKVEYTSTSLKVKASGGSDPEGRTIKYQYKISTEENWSEAIEEGIEFEIKGLTENKIYTVQARTINEKSRTSEIVEVQMKVGYDGNIGKYIHYAIDLGIGKLPTDEGQTPDTAVNDDWVVFYEDKENGYTYLIASDYVPINNSVLTKALTAANLKSSGIYNVYQTNLTGTKLDSLATSRYKLSWNGTINRLKHEATVALLNTTSWNSFALTDVDERISAVGAPTIDLWVASWNQRGYTTVNLSTNVESEATSGSDAEKYGSGYYVGTEEKTPDVELYGIGNLEKTGYNSDVTKNNPVYFPHPGNEKYQGIVGYWLAAPNAHSNVAAMYYVGNLGGPYVNYFDASYQYMCGVRPVVSIPTELIGGNDIYFVN